MKLNLNIADDSELRNAVKDMIRGQVKSIAREEIRGIIKEVFDEKYPVEKPSGDFVQSLINDALRAEIKAAYNSDLGKTTYHNGTYINRLRLLAHEIITKEFEQIFAKMKE